jgi:hypothetical protein
MIFNTLCFLRVLCASVVSRDVPDIQRHADIRETCSLYLSPRAF